MQVRNHIVLLNLPPGGRAFQYRVSRTRRIGLLVAMLLTGLAAQAYAQVELRISSWAGAEELLLEQEIVQLFMAQNPGMVVRYEPVPGNYKEKILASIAAGAVPDVFLLDSTIIPALVNRNLLLDLRASADATGVDLDAYFPNVLDVFRQNEQLYAYPKGYTPIVMFYNRRLFRDAGLTYPKADWTWQDFVSAATDLTKDHDNDGVIDQYGTILLNKLFLWQPWVWMAGGDIVSPDGLHSSGFLDSEPTRDGLQFLIDLSTRHRVVPRSVKSSDFSTANGMFFSNRVGMISSGHWSLIGMAEHINAGTLDLGVVQLPRPEGTDPATVIYASGWCVPKATPHRAEALRLAAFLAGPEAARIRARSGLEIPAIRSEAERIVAADTTGMEQVFLDATEWGRQPWGTRIEEFSRIEAVAEEAMELALLGRAPLQTALTDAARAVDAHLGRSVALEGEAGELRGNPEVIFFLLFTTILALTIGVIVVFKLGKSESVPFLRGMGFLAPSLAVLLVFVFTPVIFSLYLSFHQWNVVSSAKPFIGIRNYVDLFGDRLFWNAMKNTLVYSLHVPVGMALSLGVAVMMNRTARGISWLRTLYFLPSVSSFVAIALVWKWLYHPEFGLINYFLGGLGLPQPAWLADPAFALPAVMILSIWMGLGYQMVIFLAGLQNIPTELYESARMDGANSWFQFIKITLPLLRPTTFFVLVTSVIGSFQVFSLVYVMTEGGPVRSTDVVVYHIYQNAWDYLQMGYASAMSWVLFLIIVTGTWLQFRFLGDEVTYS